VNPVCVLIEHFCYDEAKSRFSFASWKHLRDLDKNYLCYNYLFFFCFDKYVSSYVIGGVNRTRVGG
jgi:hypothetical protein